MNDLFKQNRLCYTSATMSQITNPHDAFFKQFLSKPEIAADFLTQHLPSELLALLALPTLAEQKESFVDEALRSHFGDLLYQVQTKGGKPLYLYLLFEHKSYPDDDVAFQVLRYKVRIWEKEIGKAKRLTPIVALVVYHGEVKWTAPLNFADLFEWEKDEQEVGVVLQRYLPEFVYHLVDLSALSDAEIQGGVWLRVFELLLKHIFDPTLGQQLYNILALTIELAQQVSGMEMLVTMLRYVARAGPGASKEEIHQTVMQLFAKEGGVLMKTAAQEWMEEAEAIGLQKGEAIGLEKGMLHAQRQMILNILQHRFDPSKEALELLAKKLAQISTTETMYQLADYALQALLFNDFCLRVERLLPPPEQANPNTASNTPPETQA